MIVSARLLAYSSFLVGIIMDATKGYGLLKLLVPLGFTRFYYQHEYCYWRSFAQQSVSFTPFINLLVYSQLIILEVSELIFPHLFAVRLGSKDRFIKR